MSDLKQLEDVLAIYGADPARWPAGRYEALEVALASRAGQSLESEAAALERVLDAGGARDNAAAEASASLLAGIMSVTVDAAPVAQTLPLQRSVRRTLATDTRAWIGGVSMAAALLVGVFAGLNGFGAVITQSGVSFAQGEVPLSADESLLADLTLLSDVDLGDDVL